MVSLSDEAAQFEDSNTKASTNDTTATKTSNNTTTGNDDPMSTTASSSSSSATTSVSPTNPGTKVDPNFQQQLSQLHCSSCKHARTPHDFSPTERQKSIFETKCRVCTSPGWEMPYAKPNNEKWTGDLTEFPSLARVDDGGRSKLGKGFKKNMTWGAPLEEEDGEYWWDYV